MESNNDFCTPEDFEYFIQQRHLLQQNTSDGGVFREKPVDATVGLINHGSTCYLNSVMQCLVQNASFLKALFTTNDADDNPIVKELKRLITALVHSIRSAVGTKDLLTSFGWSQSQIHDQHDAQELYTLLLDALSQASPLLEGKLQEIFRGRDADVIQCSECQFEKTTDSIFQHLSVEVPDHLEGKQAPSETTSALSTLLADLLKSENLDENNKWECSSCKKQVCASRQHQFKTLPETIAIQLKRFRFDPTTKKRRKLNTAVEFQDSYNFIELLQPTLASTDDANGPTNGVYQLTGIICHLGTAMGGHYKSYVRSRDDPNTWWECNDDKIHKCTPEEVQTLFYSTANTNEDTVHLQQTTIMENVYVLFYSRASTATTSTTAEEVASLIPLTAEVEEDNAVYRTLMKLSQISRRIVQMTVSIYRVNEITPLSDTSSTVFDFPKQTTIQQVTQQIYDSFVKQGVLNSSDYPVDHCRVRKFSNTRNSKGETFEGRESMTLAEVGFIEKESLCFEIRTESDPAFIAYNPNEMLLSLYLWDPTQTAVSDIEAFIQSEIHAAKELVPEGNTTNATNKWLEVIVPGQEKSTVSQLFSTIREKFNLSDSQAFLVIPFIQNSNIPLHVVDDVASELRKKYQITPATKLFIELTTSTSQESVMLSILKSLRSKLRILFNNPKTTITEETPQYDQEVEVTSDLTFSQLKELFREKLGLSLSEADEFYCKRNRDGVQFKEEEKTLEQLGLTDQSIVHLQMGKGCKPGEHFLRFEIDLGRIIMDPQQNRYFLLTELPVNEKTTILALKKLLHQQWEAQLLPSLTQKLADLPNGKELVEALGSIPITPRSPHHLRLRDGKNGKISGPLRDDRMICRCLLGLSDGRRLILQVLPEEEIIGPDDVLITIRTVSFYYQKVLSDPHDIAIPRSYTIKDLYEKVAMVFPQLVHLPSETYDESNHITNSPISREENNYLEIAKGYSTGPPLTLKSSLKLKWDFHKLNIYPSDNTSEECIGNTAIDRPPMNLRDGTILVLRNHYDFLKAQEAAQQKQKEKLEAEGEIGVGGGVAAVRAKSLNSSQKRPGSSARFARPGSSARSMRGSSTEPVLKIVTHDKNHVPNLPSGKATPSSANSGGMGIAIGGGGIAAGDSPNENLMNNARAGELLPQPSPQKEI